jgi:hypothetical protein
MWLIALALFCGTFIGTLAGGLAGWWLLVRAGSARPFDRVVGDADLDGRIRRAAADWAAAHGRPEAAPLIADKLRLAHSLSQRRARRSGRWSR